MVASNHFAEACRRTPQITNSRMGPRINLSRFDSPSCNNLAFFQVTRPDIIAATSERAP
ncbi:hypothetical protein PG5_01010 [Pseudomonas sp. G5(2012)]|nr:hypothetical protein PG5_01010 [Pseudomonas sp. G5(2012)]